MQEHKSKPSREKAAQPSENSFATLHTRFAATRARGDDFVPLLRDALLSSAASARTLQERLDEVSELRASIEADLAVHDSAREQIVLAAISGSSDLEAATEQTRALARLKDDVLVFAEVIAGLAAALEEKLAKRREEEDLDRRRKLYAGGIDAGHKLAAAFDPQDRCA
jgi:hypothetical protein